MRIIATFPGGFKGRLSCSSRKRKPAAQRGALSTLQRQPPLILLAFLHFPFLMTWAEPFKGSERT